MFCGMARHRSQSRAKIDDQAFPIRVRVKVPETGYGTMIDAMIAWLRTNAEGAHAWHPGGSGGGQWTVCSTNFLYFRAIDAAQQFLAAFPGLELCDDVPA